MCKDAEEFDLWYNGLRLITEHFRKKGGGVVLGFPDQMFGTPAPKHTPPGDCYIWGSFPERKVFALHIRSIAPHKSFDILGEQSIVTKGKSFEYPICNTLQYEKAYKSIRICCTILPSVTPELVPIVNPWKCTPINGSIASDSSLVHNHCYESVGCPCMILLKGCNESAVASCFLHSLVLFAIA